MCTWTRRSLLGNPEAEAKLGRHSMCIHQVFSWGCCWSWQMLKNKVLFAVIMAKWWPEGKRWVLQSRPALALSELWCHTGCSWQPTCFFVCFLVSGRVSEFQAILLCTTVMEVGLHHQRILVLVKCVPSSTR